MELQTHIDAGLSALAPETVPWPFPLRGSAMVPAILRLEAASRPHTEEALSTWLIEKRWIELDQVGTHFVEARLIWAILVLHSLVSVPVYAQRSPWSLSHWVLFVSWEDYGLDSFKAQLETWAAWYEVGKLDSKAKSFPG